MFAKAGILLAVIATSVALAAPSVSPPAVITLLRVLNT
jgi:hypothetical protein